MEAPFTAAVSKFAHNPEVNGKALRELLNTDPEEFFRNAVPLLKRLQDEPGPTYVLVLLLSRGLLLGPLLRDESFAPAERTAIARQLSKVDRQFAIRLLEGVLADSGSDPSEVNATDRAAVNVRLRLLDLLQALSDDSRLLPILKRLLSDPDARVRSKAALLVGRSKHNTRWVEECLSEEDSRVRANAVESIWDVDSEPIRELLWNVLSDPDNRCVGNALIALYRRGEAAVIELILLMAKDERALFRSTAAWVMGRTGDPRFHPTLVNLIRDAAQVRTTAFRALGSLNQAKSRLTGGPALRVSGWRYQCVQEQDEIQVTVAREAESISGIRPTEFILYRDGAVVANYEVTEIAHPDPLLLTFLVPCRGAEPDSRLIQLLEAPSVSRRTTDRWLITSYDVNYVEAPSEQPAPPVWSGNGPLNLRAPEAPAPPLREQLPGPVQCLQAAIRAAQSAKAPQFFLLVPPNASGFSPGFLTEAGHAASALKASFHAISLTAGAEAPIDSAVRSLCRNSGGACLSSTPELLPQLLTDLFAGLIGSYRIRVPAAPGPLTVQVWSERGCGSLQLN